jgi:hypothetical protein
MGEGLNSYFFAVTSMTCTPPDAPGSGLATWAIGPRLVSKSIADAIKETDDKEMDDKEMDNKDRMIIPP